MSKRVYILEVAVGEAPAQAFRESKNIHETLTIVKRDPVFADSDERYDILPAFLLVGSKRMPPNLPELMAAAQTVIRIGSMRYRDRGWTNRLEGAISDLNDALDTLLPHE